MVEKYVGELPDMIQGNVENKRRLDNNPRDNHIKQPPYKRQNVARAYSAGPSEKKEYARTIPLCNKCKFHYNGPCTVKNQGYYRSDCPKLKNQNYGNQSGNGEACGRVYALGGGETEHDPNNIEGDTFRPNVIVVECIYAFSDSLLLTPLCCDDIHDVTICVSALAGCDKLVSEPLVIENFDVLVGMDRLSKRKFGIVCHEKVVRIPLEGDEILRVHGERTQGVVKTLMNTKVGESKLSDISVVRDFIDVFLEDLSMTTTTTSGVPHRFGSWSDTRVSYDLVIFRKEHQCRLLKRGAWSSFEVSVGITEEGEVVTYLRFIANFSKIVKPHTSLTERNQEKERVKPRCVRAMTMPIQYEVRGMILAAQSEAFKQENHPQADGKSESMVRTLEDIMRECVIDFGGSYHLSIWCAPFEAFYGRKCRSPVIWAEIGGSSLIGPELVQETTDKEVLIKEKLKAARDHQKSYANNRRKPLKFEVGDRVLLKVSPWKGMICFGKKGKLAPRYVGPFEILERIGVVAYRLRLPEGLSGVHDTFHVSNLKKCLADASLHVPLDEINVDKTLRFVEEPVEIMDREVKRFLTSFLDDGRGSGSWMFLFVGAVMLLCVPFCGQAKLLAILGGDQLLVLLCGFGTKSLEFGISFLSMTISGAASYAFSDSLLLTPLCCDDIHDVTPRVSALARCDKQ
ncbi:putative reverse transcriptase domain-containing protein [Tanacetum coccineum]